MTDGADETLYLHYFRIFQRICQKCWEKYIHKITGFRRTASKKCHINNSFEDLGYLHFEFDKKNVCVLSMWFNGTLAVMTRSDDVILALG